MFVKTGVYFRLKETFSSFWYFCGFEAPYSQVRGIYCPKCIRVSAVDSCTCAFVAAIKQSTFFAEFRTHLSNSQSRCFWEECSKETEAIRMIFETDISR